ncbi:MAG: thiamine biosynthesis protein ApbE [Halioglobus sp.]|nr:thiamine biosynthesis protein ApbE [Halioglobus sp.]
MLRVDHDFRAMGGPGRLRLEVTGRAQADAAIAAALAEVGRLERKYSRYLEDSVTTRINRAAGADPVSIDAETAGLLDYADTVWRESDGLFDLTSGVLRRAWDFSADRLPAQADIDALLPLVDWQAVERDAQTVRLARPGMEIDLGGVVKEYAADAAAAQLRDAGVAAALVDLAGDMVAVGTPADRPGWPVGIRHPAQRQQAIAALELPPGALASSGDYERCITVDGRRYGHVLDPRSGWPVRGLVAVSVLAPQCMVAGSAATVALLKGAQGIAWLDALGLPWLAVDDDLQCHGTLARA